jgi:hydrogenase maturation protease
MNFAPVARIAEALLYEGYLLYPYRSSSVKNQQRFTFGCLLPPTFPQPAGSAEGSTMHTECLLLGHSGTPIEIQARFLHLTTHIEASPREVATPCLNLHELVGHPYCHPFAFSDRCQQAVEGTVEVAAEQLDHGVFRLRVRLQNLTPVEGGDRLTREEALAWSLLSCHLLLGTRDGEFLSLLDPPEPLRAIAAACRNVGVWPVLVGDERRRDTMLAAPIILYDYPRIASESPGDLFDATEMDEMLTLRIRTLSDAEKHAMALTDPQVERMLQRCENMPPEQLLGLHGVWRNEETLVPGMRVRLRPHGRADAFDLALAGMTAVIVSVEQDFEDRIYVSVAIDDDPGRDLGLEGKPGHRFYFRPDEVEPLQADEATRSGRILIAGIGNIFFGDDAFGVEVVRRLAERAMPAGVVVKDFGIRGFDLACALQEGYHTAIVVDAIGRGGPPGTLHVLELDTDSNEPATNLDMHRLDPVQVLGLVRQMGGRLPRLRLVGCEPATLESAGDEIVNLSEPVRLAVPSAVELVCALVEEMHPSPQATQEPARVGVPPAPASLAGLSLPAEGET